MSVLVDFRDRIACAPNADAVLAALENYYSQAFVFLNERFYVHRIVAALTPHINAALLRALWSDAKGRESEIAALLLANHRIPDQEWDQALAEMLDTRGDLGENHYICLFGLIERLALVGRIPSDGRVALALQSQCKPERDSRRDRELLEIWALVSPNEAPRWPPYPVVFKKLAIDPRVDPNQWGSRLKSLPKFSYADEAALLIANPDLSAQREIREHYFSDIHRMFKILTPQEAIETVQDFPYLAFWIAAVVIGQAVSRGKPVPTSFARFISSCLSPEDWALLLSHRDREFRLRVQQIVGYSGHSRRRSRHR